MKKEKHVDTRTAITSTDRFKRGASFTIADMCRITKLERGRVAGVINNMLKTSEVMRTGTKLVRGKHCAVYCSQCINPFHFEKLREHSDEQLGIIQFPAGPREWYVAELARA